MSTTSRTEALESWFREAGGYIHPEIRISENQRSGVHLQSEKPIDAGSVLVTGPHSLSLSYLNALVDDLYPVFKQQRHRFKVEAIGFWYLLIQYVHREKSFWKPYLETLPDPDTLEQLTQPIFFEDAEDVSWLEGTDVWASACARKEVYEKYYQDGLEIFRKAGMDVRPYTWHLFRWSTAMFASRSFSSRALHPESSKYWTAYKSSPSSAYRQAVLLDMSRTSPEDLDFPVLFPGLDAANHSHRAKVDWTFDPGRFSIATTTHLFGPGEVYNNYGPKGNGELLMGYGFCIPDNPHDTVMLPLKAPPMELQDQIKAVHPGYFASADGEWSIEKATFHLRIPPQSVTDRGREDDVIAHLPEPLLELLIYLLRPERGLPFRFIEQPTTYLMSPDSEGRRFLPHVARMIIQSLAPRLTKLEAVELPQDGPKDKKQKQASIYRDSQIRILSASMSALRSYVRSAVWTSDHLHASLLSSSRPCLVTLECFLEALLASRSNQRTPDIDRFLTGIEASINTRDLEQLRLAGWEVEVWILLLCWLSLSEGNTWLFPEYTNQAFAAQADASVLDSANDLMKIVDQAAAAAPDSAWLSKHDRWSPEFIARVGGRMMELESFEVGLGEVRMCMLLPAQGPRVSEDDD